MEIIFLHTLEILKQVLENMFAYLSKIDFL